VIRVPGQLPLIAGAVSHGGLIVTSGVISPGLLGSGPVPGIAAQLDGAVGALGEVLRQAGSDLAHVMRVEAFLARPEDFPRWNEVFAATWPADPPARTTLITGFALPEVLIELQAIAVAAPT
jgi:2-iminobutanoate/2-iminopropanoate deaminase